MFFLGKNVIVWLQNQAFLCSWFKAYQSQEGRAPRVSQADEEPIFPQIFCEKSKQLMGIFKSSQIKFIRRAPYLLLFVWVTSEEKGADL